MCVWACVPMISKMENIRGITFWCAFHRQLCSALLYHLHWHLLGVRPWNGKETVPPLVCVCTYVCAIEYAHCTQPAQGEDPFSHQIFTSNHRLPAACCCNAHTLLCYWFLMYSLGKMPHKMFEQSILRIIFQVYAAQLQV